MSDLNVIGTKLLDLKKQNTSALRVAITKSAPLAQQALSLAIYDKYNFKLKDYVDDNLKLSTDSKNLEFRVSARHRVTNAIEFVIDPIYRASKTTPGKQVLAGYTGAYLRGKVSTWRGAFIFKGKSNNTLLAYRKKGEKWRDIPNQLPFGPSVAGAFGVIKEDTAPSIIDHFYTIYRQAL
ncbi:MAG: hypothetical protein HRU18_08985 [Pseudoalteromonas sp.]|uniref:hypothetical protein n=1 Tax=Pseudoalteromonas sp. TaxID=53249 RepID=UPI001D3B97D3|nr:hypothetical protein [Pseudoalteromonas sp.]NRA78332.1 hypothetical protein [Pseudoalteromonas sp.]